MITEVITLVLVFCCGVFGIATTFPALSNKQVFMYSIGLLFVPVVYVIIALLLGIM